MTLENKLFELNTLVDYGTYYLAKMSNYDVGDALVDVLNTFGDEILMHLDPYDIKEYAKDNLDMVDEDDALDFVIDNYDRDEIIESLDISSLDVLDEMSCGDICCYLMDKYNMSDIFDELGSNDALTYVVCNIDYQNIINEMELRDDNILQYVDEDVIKNYVTSNFAIEDMVDWM